MSLLTNEIEPRTAPGTVEQAAAYLDAVVLALSAAGIRTSSVEIDSRRPLTGRLVVTCAGHPETLVLDWRRDTGWWLARQSRVGVRPTGWRVLSGDPAAAPADVAGQFEHDLRDIRPDRR